MLWCFLGIFGDKKCQNLNIFLKYGSGVSCRVLLWWWLLSCPLVQGSAGFRGFRTCHRLALVLWWCAPRLLPAFLLCLWCIALEYGFISRFKGVFSGFWGVGVYLCGFGALLGLWGFCTREVFGGYMACGVFAPIFSFFHLLRLSSGALSLLSLACPLGCLASALGLVISLFVGCCFFFPYGCMRKKKGRNSLRPLLSCCGLFVSLVSCALLRASGYSRLCMPLYLP